MIEALVAIGILGVTSAGITQMYVSSVRGHATSQRFSDAVEIAAQRAETVSTMEADDAPACAGPPTCRGPGGRTVMPDLPGASGGFACSLWVDGPAVAGSSGAPRAGGRRFRVDTVIAAHPDALRQPDARLVTVSVCWSDAGGLVHEVQTQRLMVPGA